jgi:hypothetical protein
LDTYIIANPPRLDNAPTAAFLLQTNNSPPPQTPGNKQPFYIANRPP